MAVVSFPVRNKLAYPAGCVPGVDLSHPAAAPGVTDPATTGQTDALLCSAVASGGVGFVNLLNGTLSTNAGAGASFAIRGSIGPCVLHTSTATTLFSFSSRRINSATFAGIVHTGAALGAGFLTLVLCQPNFLGVYIDANKFQLYNSGLNDSGIAAANDTPYFFAASINIDAPATNAACNFCVRNLRTGQLFTSAITGGTLGSTASGNTGVWIGNDGAGDPSACYIAAAMMSQRNYLNIAQLVAWSADPWAFWYPPQQRMRVAPTAVADDYAAFYTPQHGGGAYTRMIGI